MRRGSLAALALALGATACSAAVAQSRAHTHETQPSAEASATPKPVKGKSRAQLRPHRRALTRATSYHVSSTEAHPAAKRVAEHVTLAVTTYDAGASAASIASGITSDATRRLALENAIQPLLHAGGTSRGTVVYAQMGGSTPSAVSVMVVVRQEVTGAGRTTTRTRTLDIRLVRAAGTWTFDRLASIGGAPVARPADLSPDARAVLDNPRIALPDSARWDIYRGLISPVLLHLMATIAERHTFAVTVLETGHPIDVFGTTHRSMHTFGRAVDINMVDGRHVIDERRPGSPADALVRWLLQQPVVSQVGSPWDLDGPSARSFTNDVHLDHVHISV